MWVSELEFNNIRSFAASGAIKLSKNINILLGANNAGKSTIIRTLYLLQQNGLLSLDDIRIGETVSSGSIQLEDVNNPHFQQFLQGVQGVPSPLVLQLFAHRTNNNFQLKITDQRGFNPVAAVQPQHFIYPYLSKRKVQGYTQEVNIQREREVGDNLINLVAKVDALANGEHPNHEEYEQACIDTFGFPITAFSSPGGKQAGIIVDRDNKIPLESMGEGVPNLLGLIVNLCLAEEKLFLIEEIENDVHPRALKRLLQLVTKKAENNQFVISTHSNIVTRYLGIVPESKIHEITIAPYSRENRIPTSTYKDVKTPEERFAALESLGYELIDAEIWDGWLLLEEASAEQIIRELLIPTFAPKLHGKIKTVSTKGIDRTKARFEAMNSLFVFAHLTPVYANRAWIVLDGDEGGRKVIQELKDEYANEKGKWKETNFINWQESNFERYYPARFRNEKDNVLNLPHKDKYEGKKALLKTVLDFIEENRETAKEEFAQSAQEVIKILREIEESLFPAGQS